MSEAAYTSEGLESPRPKQCSSLTRAGKPCQRYVETGGDKCPTHAQTPAQRSARARELAALSAEAKRKKAGKREEALENARMGLKAMLGQRLEAEAEAVTERMRSLALSTDDTIALRGLELWLARVYGKAVQPSVDVAPDLPQSIQALMDMTPEERRARLIALSSDSPPSAP